MFAIGVNCTAPQYVKSLAETIRGNAPGKQVVVYPNSGQVYDTQIRTWTGEAVAENFGEMASDWADAGATLIGGCCQTGPEHIRAIRDKIFD